MDGTRSLRWLGLVLVLPAAILTIPAVFMHSVLATDELRYRGYGALSPQIHRYSDVRRLVVVDGYRERGGKFDPHAEILLYFQDGGKWSSADNRDFVKTVDPALLEFLQAKTRLAIEHFKTEKDISPKS
jgi:hypothetical protein